MFQIHQGVTTLIILLNLNIIEPVRGLGKGKYKFKKPPRRNVNDDGAKKMNM